MKATSAIKNGFIPSPPDLSQGMIAAYRQIADAQGRLLVPVQHQLKYGNEIDSPILLMHGEQLLELVDDYEPVTGNARLAASRDQTWFRLVSGAEPIDEDTEFLAWRLDQGSWHLCFMEQYLA
ncbi:hypothetical protein [Pseudoxanthomonas mexicana]|uniref:hypothetical protein n=1 Tax=Pseudoxanthomonas mexicana TaxID=128785 RepID=UPI00398B2322